VKGGAKGKKKAASKGKGKSVKKSVEPAGEVRQTVGKILKYTPNKSAGKKEVPAGKGRASAAKRSVSKKYTPSMPSPHNGKASTKTTDQMTMAQFINYLDW